MTRYVIIGGGIAGTTAAEAIKAEDAAGQITILSAENHRLYSRIMLPNYLAGRVEKDKLYMRRQAWYAEHGVELRTGEKAASIDPENKKVLMENGAVVAYDKLLLANGASSFIIPFPGHDLDGVQAMRTIEDVDKLVAATEGGKKVVLIGGGLLGLEMAAALSHRGAEVTVIEVFAWLLPRQLDPEGGEVLKKILEKQGLHFRLDAKVESISGEGTATGVKLPDEELPAAAVLMSAGVRPNLDLAKTAGIEVDKGVIINDKTQTSVSDIYAAGDCTEHKGRPYGLWPAAEEQGQTAGTVMAGGEAEYTGTTMGQSLKVSGVSVFSAGEINAEGDATEERTSTEDTYRKVVKNKAGKVIGAVLIGDVSERKKLQAEISS
jgi:nitrite reductase (NADH) large subunit